MPEYKCRDCGEYFDKPYRRVERHGFQHGPFEEWDECPFCGGVNYAEFYIVEAEEAEEEC